MSLATTGSVKGNEMRIKGMSGRDWRGLSYFLGRVYAWQSEERLMVKVNVFTYMCNVYVCISGWNPSMRPRARLYVCQFFLYRSTWRNTPQAVVVVFILFERMYDDKLGRFNLKRTVIMTRDVTSGRCSTWFVVVAFYFLILLTNFTENAENWLYSTYICSY